jgi:hypothetical protein
VKQLWWPLRNQSSVNNKFINKYFGQYLLTPSFIFLQRIINFLYSYFIIQILSKSEYAGFSTLVYLCNFSLQLLKYGFDLRFQKIIYYLNRRNSRRKLNVVYSQYSQAVMGMSILGSFISILLHATFFINVFPLSYTDYLAVFLSLFGLFGLGLITTASYAVSRFNVVVSTLALQFTFYLAALLYLHYFGSGEAFFIYSIAASGPVYYILTRHYGLKSLNFPVFSLKLCKKFKLRQEFTVYLNNTAVILFQLLLLSIVAHKSSLWISEYRVLQSVHAVLSLIPIAIGGYLFNSKSTGKSQRSSHANFILVQVYFLCCGLALFFQNIIVNLFPTYATIIEQFLDFYLLLNVMTVISNSFLFSSYTSVNIREFFSALLIVLPSSLFLVYLIPPQSLTDFLSIDVFVQFLIYCCLLFSSRRAVINAVDFLNFVYVIFLIGIVIFDFLQLHSLGFIMIIVSIIYICSVRKFA